MVGKKAKSYLRRVVASANYHSTNFRKELRGRVVVLAYHRVLRRAEVKPHIHPAMYVVAEAFESQMRFVRERFTIVPLGEMVDRWKRHELDPDQRYAVITFDDGWRDNYENAFPILRNLCVPATVFLTTEMIGGAEWFWPEKLVYLAQYAATSRSRWEKVEPVLRRYMAPPQIFTAQSAWKEQFVDALVENFKRLPIDEIDEIIGHCGSILAINIPKERVLMSWSEVDEMSHAGIAFGSHGCTHRILTSLPIGDVEAEVSKSQTALLSRKVNYSPVFCYPNGNYCRKIQAIVQRFYQAAVSTDPGSEGPIPDDLFAIKRIGIHNDITSTLPLFALRLFRH